MFGLILLTAVELIVRGLGVRPLAVLRFTQLVVRQVLLSIVQERGVMRDENMVGTTSRQEVVNRLLSSWNEQIRLADDDYVLGDAMIGAVGIKLLVGMSIKTTMTMKDTVLRQTLTVAGRMCMIYNCFILSSNQIKQIPIQQLSQLNISPLFAIALFLFNDSNQKRRSRAIDYRLIVWSVGWQIQLFCNQIVPFILIMKYNQKVLELHPHTSKLIDSLCFELAVNIPDQNSLSLFEILEMRKQGQITFNQFMELYVSWLEAKNVFDIFTAKQVKIYPKGELIANMHTANHLHLTSINSTLELLHDLYDSLFEKKKHGHSKHIKETEDLFSYLDCDGNIHLRLSQLFFLNAALLIYQKAHIPIQYEHYKTLFKLKNTNLCEIDGMVSLRWFKNYFLFEDTKPNLTRTILDILKQFQIAIKRKGKQKASSNGLPNVLEQAFIRWKGSARFTGLFQSKKKRVDIYHRVFDQNETIFFFNGGKDDSVLNQTYFIKKYGEEYVKFLQIDNPLLKEFSLIVQGLLEQYLTIINEVASTANSRIQKSAHNHSPVTFQTPIQQANSTHLNLSNTTQFNNSSKKAHKNGYLTSGKNPKIQTHRFIKEKTPTKRNKNNDFKHASITPTNKNTKTSPYLQRQFASTSKSPHSKNTKQLTPNKNRTSIYNSALYMPNNTQTYRCSQKEGLGQDSFYDKLFFFRNKRVESYEFVMKRLKGK